MRGCEVEEAANGKDGEQGKMLMATNLVGARIRLI
jgi:hypothetical protein